MYFWRPVCGLRLLFLPILFVLTMYRDSSVHSISRQNLHWAHCAKQRRVASPSMVHDAVWRLQPASGPSFSIKALYSQWFTTAEE
jgi:hypothetical protein